jgi:hypothetical protein
MHLEEINMETKNPLGRKAVMLICHHCDYHFEDEDSDWEDYAEWDEVVYQDDVGCPMCRHNKGFTPYITFVKD